MGHEHILQLSTIDVFSEVKAAFNSFDHKVLWECLKLNGVTKITSTLYSLSIQTLLVESEIMVNCHQDWQCQVVFVTFVRFLHFYLS